MSTVTVHVPVVPEQEPLQPTKRDPDDGIAVRVTVAPLLYSAEQIEPQLMLPLLLVTVPTPLPVLTTVSVYSSP